MPSVAEQLIDQLAASGVRDFFGVQGGACAHLIRASSLNETTSFTPVLNEQAAGLCAHGYFKATGRPAGAIVTTGPGFSNLVTGMLACYVDRVPLVVLCGQVSSGLNLASQFGTRMYGFQEIDHSSIAAHFSEYSIRVTGSATLAKAMHLITNLEVLQGPLFLEIQDDLQRAPCPAIESCTKGTRMETLSEGVTTPEEVIESTLELLQSSTRPVLVVGAGVTRTSFEFLDEWTAKEKIPTLFSWGAQHLFDGKIPLHQGLFGTHSPGRGNELLRHADLLICMGVGLLQHQVGKEFPLFAPEATIVYINSDSFECARISHDFSSRANIIVSDCLPVAKALLKFHESQKIDYWPDHDWYSVDNIISELLTQHVHEGVSVLMELLGSCSSETVVFSDAGQTLSWTYQAANLVNAPAVFSSFNLHTMGYALPAAVGAAQGGQTSVISINGDGGLMMNSQEFPHARNRNVKTFVLDNQGYGIIRQTQDDFLGGDYSGSSPFHPRSPLPEYDVLALSVACGIPSRRIQPDELTENLTWFLTEGEPRTLVVDIDPTLKVLGVGL